MSDHASPIIAVEDARCVSCHACIAVCPVKYCMDGSGDVIKIDHERCIGCGRCIQACSHEARSIIDDFSRFLDACERRERMIAIQAPAAASVFPGNYLKLNTLIVSMGVECVFDVSFGAELTIRSYKNYIDEQKPRTVISQPCPAVVTYIELYRPELLGYLAPYDSPMTHTMKMIRKHYPEYRHHKIVCISPCVAKKREFEETGLGDYNVTLLSLKNHILKNSIDLSNLEQTPFAGPEAERAVLFSTPGGLLRTYMRENPDILPAVRKIEGTETLYPYLSELHTSLENDTAPGLIDCLNCEKGCNGGPGTGNSGKHMDELERPVETRALKQMRNHTRSLLKSKAKKFRSMVNAYWDAELYKRSYRDLSSRTKLREPGEAELAAIYMKMLKEKEKDFLNCTACGYTTCKGMAVAIHNGLNKPENCHQYQKKRIERTNIRLAEGTEMLRGRISEAVETIGTMRSFVESVNDACGEQFTAIEESNDSVAKMVESIRKVTGISSERQVIVTDLKEVAGGGRKEITNSVRAVQEIADSVTGVYEVVQMIDDIAARTNLLSMNASIEAAHAGTAGKGFTVVASEIRKLAGKAAENSRLIKDRLDHISVEIRETVQVSERMGESIHTIIDTVNTVAEGFTSITSSLLDMSSGSEQMAATLEELHALAGNFRSAFESMRTNLDSIFGTMESIAEISSRTVAGDAGS